jgi:hypothetical protein
MTGLTSNPTIFDNEDSEHRRKARARGEYPSASESAAQGAVRRHCEAGRAPKGAGLARRGCNARCRAQ